MSSIRLDLIDLRSAFEDADDATKTLGHQAYESVQSAISTAIAALNEIARAARIAKAELAIARAERDIATETRRIKELQDPA
jgi:hypothetical protein